jgi:hypothetical protein
VEEGGFLQLKGGGGGGGRGEVSVIESYATQSSFKNSTSSSSHPYAHTRTNNCIAVSVIEHFCLVCSTATCHDVPSTSLFGELSSIYHARLLASCCEFRSVPIDNCKRDGRGVRDEGVG